MRSIFISDVHGCAKTLDKILNKLSLQESDKIFFLGDLVNKGPRTKSVLEIILSLQNAHAIKLLKGNHEHYLLESYFKQIKTKHLSNGIRNTLKSYNLKSISQIPENHIRLISNLDLVTEYKGQYLVHAGLNFNRKEPSARCTELMNIRSWYHQIDYEWLQDKHIVHGHYPITLKEQDTQLKYKKTNQYLNLDTGCVYSNIKGKGYLSAYILENNEILRVKNIDY